MHDRSTPRKAPPRLDPIDRPEPPSFDDLSPLQAQAGQHLRAIHDQFRRNMAVLRDLLDRAGKGEVAASEIEEKTAALPLLRNVRMFGTLCGQHCRIISFHHQIEDEALFPQLAQKSTVLSRIVARLKLEHEAVHHHLEETLACLAALQENPQPAQLEAAEAAYGELEALLLSHFTYEEDAIGEALGAYDIMV